MMRFPDEECRTNLSQKPFCHLPSWLLPRPTAPAVCKAQEKVVSLCLTPARSCEQRDVAKVVAVPFSLRPSVGHANHVRRSEHRVRFCNNK
eukprot:3012770-Amphidinium_carterae.2